MKISINISRLKCSICLVLSTFGNDSCWDLRFHRSRNDSKFSDSHGSKFVKEFLDWIEWSCKLGNFFMEHFICWGNHALILVSNFNNWKDEMVSSYFAKKRRYFCAFLLKLNYAWISVTYRLMYYMNQIFLFNTEMFGYTYKVVTLLYPG